MEIAYDAVIARFSGDLPKGRLDRRLIPLTGTLQMPTQNKRFRRFVPRSLRLPGGNRFELMLEFLDDLAVTAAMKAFDQESAIRLQVILRKFEREIADVLDPRRVSDGHP